ncbi:Hypothetical protein ETEE_3657 [Edwardsiella anguillarum ET080813]|uniref:Uncharacterized protein n=1 Tax=Edwardsiella anguillarum ET080813 TaxID=667120 RepID=A0A076LTR9_9GAMM|nr:Hypothetical protein ETEE_3657 [Edwardsiella anguillarum ET080813]
MESRALKVGIMQALNALLFNRSLSAPFCQFQRERQSPLRD